MVRVKVCGLGSIEQIDWAIELGYDAMGVVVTPRSKRYCMPDTAKAMAQHADGKIETFAVAYKLDEVGDLGDYFDTIQLYQPAAISNLAYASDAPPPDALACRYFFYDASVGSGHFQPIPQWVRSISHRLYLAGGLNDNNVGNVIATYRPYGVDVSSAVELSPLVKCRNKMAQFIHAVRQST